MIHIVAEDRIPDAGAFWDVRRALEFDQDVYLFAQLAKIFGIELSGVVYNMEPLYDGCRSLSIGYMETLKRCKVLDYSAANVEYLKAHGVEAFHMPYGYHPSLERVKPVAKDIDVLFFGSWNTRRAALFSKMPRHINFVWAQGVYGDALDRLIARAKVHVNVHYCDSHQLEVVRLNYLLANGCTVVSEPGNEAKVNEAYAPGMLYAQYSDIIHACIYALDHPKNGQEAIRAMPHDCGPAQRWLSSYLHDTL